ncbi:sensor histidine kinase [Streptococcus suis]|uniref:sensor histidine kinase n=1 Tax=Streptococcus suis TaxID=1307 RepID=UPI001920BE9E|nr:histidine kinase [Streptococcus suis]MBL1125061.1 sensor histidine kinase [Streptococcus suis]
MIQLKKRFTFNNYSIKHQLLLIILPLILLSTILIGGLLVLDSTRQLEESYNNLLQTDAKHTRSIVHDATSSFEKYADNITSNEMIRSILSKDYQDFKNSQDHLTIHNMILDLRRRDTSISSIQIYTDNPSIPSYRGIISLADEKNKPQWLEQASTQMTEFWTTTSQDEDNSLSVLTLYQQIPLPLSPYKAYLEMKLDYNYLNNRINNSSYINQLSLNHGDLFYSDQFSDMGQKAPFINEESSSAVKIKRATNDGKNSLLATTNLKLNNQTDTITIYAYDNQALGAINNNILRWSAILLLFSLIAIVLTLYFIRFFSHRLQLLHEAVYRASIEDYQYFKEIDGKDEISTISLNFHKILNRMKKTEEEIYKSKLHEQELINQQQKMAFSILASQINPHFLFNTLETIRMTALKNQDKDVAHATKLLSQSMRYTLSNQGSAMTTLQRELDAIDVYTQIQQLRFGERVNYHCKVDSTINTNTVHLLPLLIQPLIENAISHGLEGITENGYVTLTIEPALNSTLVITVSDNGIGISPDQLRIIQDRISLNDLEDTNHIGLKNVHNRICQYYGEDYGLTIHSQLGQGTKIQLLLPLENKN